MAPVRELAVISGRKGAGKATLIASFATLAKKVVIVDCDIKGSHLCGILGDVDRSTAFLAQSKATIIVENCTACGDCCEACDRHAILPVISSPKRGQSLSYWINPDLCEGCEACEEVCPEGAIVFEAPASEEYRTSLTRYGFLISITKRYTNSNLGRYVFALRKRARDLAVSNGIKLILVNCPSTTDHSIVTAIGGVDLVLIVEDPTEEGQEEMTSLSKITGYFHIPVALCINKWNKDAEKTSKLEKHAHSLGLQLIGKVRFDRMVSKAFPLKSTVIEYTGAAISQDIKEVWRNVDMILGTNLAIL